MDETNLWPSFHRTVPEVSIINGTPVASDISGLVSSQNYFGSPRYETRQFPISSSPPRNPASPHPCKCSLYPPVTKTDLSFEFERLKSDLKRERTDLLSTIRREIENVKQEVLSAVVKEAEILKQEVLSAVSQENKHVTSAICKEIRNSLTKERNNPPTRTVGCGAERVETVHRQIQVSPGTEDVSTQADGGRATPNDYAGSESGEEPEDQDLPEPDEQHQQRPPLRLPRDLAPRDVCLVPNDCDHQNGARNGCVDANRRNEHGNGGHNGCVDGTGRNEYAGASRSGGRREDGNVALGRMQELRGEARHQCANGRDLPSSEISMTTNAVLAKYLPAEKLLPHSPMRRAAPGPPANDVVFNMTNVSLAMRYPAERGSPPRAPYLFPPRDNRFYGPQPRRQPDLQDNRYHDWPQQTPCRDQDWDWQQQRLDGYRRGNVRLNWGREPATEYNEWHPPMEELLRGETEWGDEGVGRGHGARAPQAQYDRILDITAIQNLPKLN